MDQPKILVAIRKRPISKKEQTKGDSDIISIKNNQTLIVSQYKQKVDLTKYLEETVFNFDFVYGQSTKNQQIYETAVRPLVNSAFMGAKVTCFAYGQTGSGKTFTMNGSSKLGITGLYALGAQDIFAYLSNPKFQHLKARLSYFQIYCGKLFDLLNKRQELKILEDKKNNINIIGLQQTHITSWEQFLQLLQYGSTQRITSQNSANSQSSRSHAILQISLKDGKKLFGKISFIDLAGNERGADHTDMKKQTRIDGAQINKSLLSLKECIRALDQGKGHTPFRGSKLTMVLKDSFIGFCRTLMIGNVSPSSASSQNTLNTLRYADRVKQLRKPTQGLSKQELKARQMMLPRQGKNAIKISIDQEDDAEDIEEKREKARQTYGFKEEPKEREEKLLPKQDQTRMKRQQSFGGKNEMKTSQILEGKRQTMNQPSKQFVKQSNVPVKGKTNAVSNNKNVPNFAERNEKNPILKRSNSIQGEGPKAIVHQKNKQFEMDIQEDSNHNIQQVQNYYQQQQPQIYQNQMQQQPQMNNFMPQPYNPQLDQYRSGYQIQSNSQVFNYQKNPYQNSPPQNQNYRSGGNSQPLKSNTHLFNNSELHQPIQKVFKEPIYQNPQSILPNDWEGLQEMHRSNSNDEVQYRIRQKMNEQLFSEQNELMNNHSNSLRSSLDIIKSQMNILSILQNEKDSMSTREYIHFMQESIDEKISILEMLRQKMAQFSYKLDIIEEMEDNGNRRGDDEQLLDDLH